MLSSGPSTTLSLCSTLEVTLFPVAHRTSTGVTLQHLPEPESVNETGVTPPWSHSKAHGPSHFPEEEEMWLREKPRTAKLVSELYGD